MLTTKTNMNIRQREVYMDILKCFAIFLVLSGHCVQYLVSSQYAEEPLYRIIYSFHMPLFIMIVGYFFAKGVQHGFFKTAYKKFNQLILPFLVWTILIIIAKQIRVGLPSIGQVIVGWAYSLWFLKTAFVCCILGYFVFITPSFKRLSIGGYYINNYSITITTYTESLLYVSLFFNRGTYVED